MRQVRVALSAVVIVVVLWPLPAAAQSGRNGDPPPGWMIRYDLGEVEAIRPLEVMRPGWHIFAGPGALLWDPSRHAEGNYSVTCTVFVFAEGDGESSSRSLEAPYGIMLGGTSLESGAASYVEFVVRADGTFAVMDHSGNTVSSLVPWTEHEAVATLAPDDVTAENVLSVDATGEVVTFWVNGQQVAERTRSDLALAGIVGLRAGADLSLHVSELTIGPNRR